MQYPAHEYNGYVYGPPFYPYAPQPYYQQAPGGQYLLAPPSLPTGGVMLLESQDPPGMVVSSGFNNINAYPGGLPVPGFQVPMVPPPVHCEKGAIAVTYVPSHILPSHTLRASAPAWIEPSAKPLGVQKQGKPAETQQGPPSSADSFQSRKSPLLNPPVASSTVPKSGPPCSDVIASYSQAKTPDPSFAPVDTGTKLNGSLEDDDKQQMKGNGQLNSQNASSKAQLEENKDLWASKVRGQQLVPVMKNLKVSCGSPNKDVDNSLPFRVIHLQAPFLPRFSSCVIAFHFFITICSNNWYQNTFCLPINGWKS